METSQYSSDYATIWHQRTFKFLGVWPEAEEEKLSRFSKSLKRNTVIFCILGLLSGELLDVNDIADDNDKVTENLATTFIVIMVFVKFLLLHSSRKDLKICYDEVVEDWKEPRSFEDQKLMHFHAKAGRYAFFLHAMLLYSTLLLFIVDATVHSYSAYGDPNAELYLPVRSKYFFDVQTSPIYECVFTFQIITSFLICTANFSIDSFFVMMILHICGQLRILKVSIEGVASDLGVDRLKSIANIVECHLKLIRFAERLEKSYNLIILSQLFVGTLIICLVGFKIITTYETTNTWPLLKYCMYMSAMLLQIFLYSFAGDYLYEESTGVRMAAYNADWYLEGGGGSTSKALLLIMARAQKPLYITAGKFYPMSLENFTSILNTSAAYLSVLRAIYS